MILLPARRASKASSSAAPLSSVYTPERASAPRPPSPSPAVRNAAAARKVYLALRETVEQRSMLRGLMWLALIALIASMVRAGVGRTFYAGWWRQW